MTKPPVPPTTASRPPEAPKPISPYAATRPALPQVEVSAPQKIVDAANLPGVEATSLRTSIEVVDRGSLNLSDLPSVAAEELSGFSMEGQTIVSPPLHTEVRELAQKALARASLVDDPGEALQPAPRTGQMVVGDASDEVTETFDLPKERSLVDDGPPAESARRLLDESAALLRTAVQELAAASTTAPLPPGLAGMGPSLKAALQRIEHVRWIIGKGGSRG